MAEERAAALAAQTEAARARATAGAPVRLAELPHRSKLVLRAEAEAALAAADALGFALPLAPNTSAGGDGAVALWLGPDEWLLTTARDGHGALAARLREVLADRHAALVDVSDSRTMIALAGSRARDVLAKGCPLDLHPRAFAPGAVAQSLVGKAGVILHRTADDAFDLYVLRSFADYLWRFLEEAAGEWGFEIG